MTKKQLTLLTILKFVAICTALAANVERVDLDFRNPKYLMRADIDQFFFNRTLRMLNVTCTLVLPSNSDNDYAEATAFIFLSNRYVLSGIQGKVKIKDLLNYPFFNAKEVFTRSIIPPITKWPIEAGTYHAYNLYMSSKGLPNIPEGRYKIVVKLFFRNEKAASANTYLHVY